MQPPTLRSVAQTTIIRTLVCSPENCAQQRLLVELFRSTEGSCLSEEILTLIIEQFPQWLTDELLYVLAPKHVKRLKLKGCSLVTCEGLIKTIVRCSHLNQLDFSGCVNLLHPTVFCCLKDFAPHITHLMFEDCELMTDDSVQIILMCCPKLEHLNISSCKNITDKAFTFISSSDTNRLSQHAQLAGRNLSSVDVSGCQSLTSTAVRNLVALCGPTLTSINIAWTGVGCIALLYLTGLSLEAAIQFVQEADSTCLVLLQSNSDNSVSQEPGGTSSNENIDTSESLYTENSHSIPSLNGEHVKIKIDDKVNEGPSNLSVENSSPEQQEKLSELVEIADDQTLKGQRNVSEQNLSEIKVATEVTFSHNCSDSAASLVTCSNEGAKVKSSQHHSCEISCCEQGDDHLRKSETLQKQHSHEYQDNTVLCSEHTSSSTDEIASMSNVSLPEYHTKQDTTEDASSSSLDEKWMLAWQQIDDDDESCNDNDELFDSMWNDEPVGVESVSSAFGHGISCLTSALVELDLYHTDDDDDVDDDDDHDGDDNVDCGDDYNYNNDGDDNEVNNSSTIISKEFPSEQEFDSHFTEEDIPSKDNYDDDDDGHQVVTAEQNVQCSKTPVDASLTSSNDNTRVAGLPPPPREDLCTNDIPPHDLPCKSDSTSSLNTKDMMTSDDSSNDIKQLDNDNCNIQASTASNEHDSTITCRDDENNIGNHGDEEVSLDENNIGNHGDEEVSPDENNIGNHGDEEVSLDEADQLLAQILDVHEQSCYDCYSPLHGFNDALVSLTNAMVDLINVGDDDDDDDSDDDNGDDDDNEKIYDEKSFKVMSSHCQNILDDDGVSYDDDDDATKSEKLLVGHQCYHGNHDSIDLTGCCHGDHDGNEQSNQTQSQDSDRDHSNNDTFDSESDEGVDVCKVESLNSITMEQVNLVLLPSELEDDLNSNLCECPSSRDTGQTMSGIQKEDEMMRDDDHLLDNNDLQPLDMNPTSDPPTNTSLDTKSSAENTTKISEHMTTLNLTHKPRLHTIDISNIYFHSKPLGVACLKIFTTMNKSLHSFATSWTELDDDTLIDVVKNEPELRSLSLIDCEKITDRCLMLLPVYCPRLEKIDLKGVPFITDIGVVPMLILPCLQTLSIAETSVTDISMFSIAEKCCDKLRVLDLSWCEDVTDKGLSAMATSCTGLCSLGLRQCAASFVTMETLSSYCHGLTSLNFAGLDQLTDQMVSTMATNIPNLTVVDLSWNSGLTSIGIGALMLNCSRLKEAILNGLKALTSKPFLPIIADLPRWRTKQEVMLRRKLKRQQSGGPAETAIKPCSMEMTKSLGEDLPFRSTTYCPVLRYLDLVYSDKVNDDHLSQIVAVCRGTLSVRDYYSRLMEPMWIFLR